MATPLEPAWSRACRVLAESIERELVRLRAGSRPVSVAPLGVRDELTPPPARAERAQRSTVPGPASPGPRSAGSGATGATREGGASQALGPARAERAQRSTVFLTGRIAIVGPVRPAGSAGPGCPRCLARRWQLSRPDGLRDGVERGAPSRAVGSPPLLTGFATTALAALIASVDDRDGGGGYPDVYTLDLATGAVGRTRLVPDADCPQCGDDRPDTPEAALVKIEASPKRASGGSRGRALEELDLPLDALVNPVCGMVGSQGYPTLALPSTAMVTGSFRQRSDRTLYEIHWGGHANRFGTSRLVGAVEGLERHAGVAPRGRRAATRASLTELGPAALDPRDCGVYSDEFYAADRTTEPFSPDRPIDWVWGYSLRDERPILVPLVLTYYHSAPRSERFVQACSSGCASGSSLVEAIYFGLSELVERDAFLLTWYGQLARPEIDPMTSDRPATRIMVDRLRMHGYRARFFDATTTLGIPVVVAAAQRMDGGLGALCFGAGAGLDPEEALAGALDEIATDALFLRERTEHDRARLEAMAADFDRVVALHDHPILYGLPVMSRYAEFLLGARPPAVPLAVSALRPPGESTADLAEDLRSCVASVAGAGFDVIVVDQTSPEQRGMGLRTASVLVPGLLPIDFGWRRQRALTMPRLRTAGSGRPNPAPHPFP